ncbi:MAG: GNAT family N-acetyltransferase [Christensenellales bacterium]
MIDERWQGRGYGRQAIEKLIEYARHVPVRPGVEVFWLSYDPDNQKARKLYNGFGFMETGAMDGEEAIAALKL